MGLVEDDGIVIGQDPGAVVSRSQGEVGEVERMVGDHELCAARTLAGRLRVAGAHVRTAPPSAAVGADRDLGPERRARLEGELGAVSRLRRLYPGTQAFVVGRVLGGPEEAAEPVDAAEALAAEVVLAALEDGYANLAPQCRRSSRHIFSQKLLL